MYSNYQGCTQKPLNTFLDVTLLELSKCIIDDVDSVHDIPDLLEHVEDSNDIQLKHVTIISDHTFYFHWNWYSIRFSYYYKSKIYIFHIL